MKKYFLFIFLLPVICFAQKSTKPFVHYNIYATLNSDDKTITAYEKITYKNASDTAQSFLWIRLYPNAYASDRTAYSDYMIDHGDLRFYFAKDGQRGYINHLDFKENDIALKTDFDSAKNDLIKVYLSNPLQPGDSAEIATPFFVKISYNFSGFGYDNDDGIELTHWFPEVAYEDRNGWNLNPFTSYKNLKNTIANLDAKIVSNKNTYQSNATVLSKTEEENKTIINYHSINTGDFNLSTSLNPIVCCDVPPKTEENFDKLIPNFLPNKRPDNPDETQYLINQKIHGIDTPYHKSLKPVFLLNLKETDKYNYLSFLPAVGYNNYDKAMLGIMIHNYQLPLNKFNFLIAPMYATNSKSLAGVGRLEYNIWNKNNWWRFSLSGTQYSTGELVPSESVMTQDQKTLYYQMRRVVPSINYTKYLDDARNKKWNFLLRTFFLREEGETNNPTKINDSTYYFYKQTNNSTIAELQTTFSNNRALYPYNANLKIDGDKDFLRIAFTGNGFLNYDASGKGLNVRVFAGKFFCLNSAAHYGTRNFDLIPYQFSLTSTAAQDFTYSDYFIGRSETSGWMSQQIVQNDGFFKISTPPSYQSIGISDNWIAALNFTADIPDNINPFSKLPFKMPVRAFLDAGTYSEAWTDNISAPSGKYLYDAGLQVSLLHDALTVYFPLLYSKVFRDAYRSAYPVKRFVHTISFSIDLANLKPKALNKILPL